MSVAAPVAIPVVATPVATPVLHRLPADLQELVRQHWAASTIQAHLARWHRYRHVRRRSWPRLRARLPRTVHATLVRYAGIRQEWYREPGSWVCQTDDELHQTLHTIVEEARAGFWGRALR